MNASTWAVPSIIASLLATGAVVAVTSYLYAQNRASQGAERQRLPQHLLSHHLALWAAAGLVYGLRLGFALLVLYVGVSPGLVALEYLCLLVSSTLLIWGTYRFLDMRRPRWTVVGPIVGAAWLLVSSLAAGLGLPAVSGSDGGAQPLWFIWLPISLATATAFTWSGILLLRRGWLADSRLLGWGLVWLGLYRAADLLLASGLLLPAPAWSETWGFTVNALWVLGLAFAVWRIYLDRAYARLAASEARFRRLARNLPDVIFTYGLTPPPGLRYVSPAATVITGYTPEELCAAPTLLERSLDAESLAALQDAAAGGRSQAEPLVCLWRHKAGRDIWLEVRLTHVRDDWGAPIAVEGVARDVTARLEGEASLLRSSSLLQATMNAASDALVVTDLGGAVMSYNQRFADLMGAEWPERAVADSTPAYEARPERDLFDCLPALRNLESLRSRARRASERPELISQDLLECMDGRILECAGVPQYLGHDIVGRVWSFRDVTKLSRAEVALRDAEERFRQIVEQMPFPIEVYALDGTALLTNRAFGEMCAAASSPRAASSQGSRSRGPCYTEESLQDAFRGAGNGETVYLPEIRLPSTPGSGNGRSRPHDMVYEVIMFPVVARSGKIEEVVAIWNDLTERRRLAERLRDSQKIETLGRLAGGVAHDFNNLLTAISGYGTMARELVQPQCGELGEYLDEVLRAGHRAAGLTRQLLAFSRRQLLEPQPVDLNELIRDVSKMLRRVIGEDIEFQTVLAPDIATVHVDPGQIEQVLVNLAVNARDAMLEGGTLTIETANVFLDERFVEEHEGANTGAHVQLIVSDTGHGLSDEAKDHLFEPFFTTKEQGTGLGLATVFGIIKQHNGNIYLSSEPDSGTEVSIYLPRADEDATPVLHSGRPTSTAGGTETVLVVEDDAVVREVMVRSLARRGYRVLEAPNGPDAVRLAKQRAQAVHLLITDVVMPKMSGGVLALRLAEIYPGLKVLFVSGYAERVARLDPIAGREPGFLHKPFTGEALALQVRHVLDTH